MENPTHDSPPPDTLPALAEAAKTHRLSPADEEKAAALLIEQLKGGRAGITAAIEPLLAFQWMVSVQAISAVWSELSQPMQRHLLSSLAKVETEQARRLRLSIARAVFKIDPAAGTRLAIAVAADLRNAETGTLSTRNRQLFFHVFIGKGKPWICLLPLEGAKGADALVHAAIEILPLCPPISQLSILRWIYAGGRFKRLGEEHLAAIAKSVGRWNYRLQQALKANIPDLPEVITAGFKPERPEPKAAEKAPAEAAQPADVAEAPVNAEESTAEPSVEAEAPAEAASPEFAEPADPSEPEATGEEAPPAKKLTRAEQQANRRRERDARREEQREQRRREREKERGAERGSEKEREPEKTSDAGRVRRAFDPKNFDLRDTLRGVESYVASLRQELEQTKAQLRRKDDESISSRRARRAAEEAPAVDVEELTRHNARLEGTIADLRQQLDDLAAHHEAVAESRALHGDEPLPEGSADQLRALLNIKLHESYETYLAMKEDPLDRVFRLDYRDLLGSIFDVLQQEGVSLKRPAK